VIDGDRRLAGVDDVDRFDESLAGGVFEQKAGCAGSQRAVDVFVEVEGRQHKYARWRVELEVAQARGRLDAVHGGHADVHQDHVGAQLPRAHQCLLAVGRLTDDL